MEKVELGQLLHLKGLSGTLRVEKFGIRRDEDERSVASAEPSGTLAIAVGCASFNWLRCLRKK